MIQRKYHAQLGVGDFVSILDSVAAHIAAKLQLFGSDERTLTDEICDMFSMWAEFLSVTPAAGPTFTVDITKTTQREEARTGNDLLISIVTPFGLAKDAAFQAKVLDPDDEQLRCYSAADWQKLLAHLRAIRRYWHDLAFLLVYVPMCYLDGREHGFSTWEQSAFVTRRKRSSRFGVIAISVDDLLTPSDLWQRATYLRHVGKGRFDAPHVSFSRLVADLLTCSRGKWAAPAESHQVESPAFHLTMSFGATPPQRWEAAVAALRELTKNRE